MLSDVRGAFNIAAEPVIDPAELSRLFGGARRVRLPVAPVRAVARATYALRLQPTEPGWLDMGLGVPLMDSSRARRELGWEPTRSATDALAELLAGFQAGADLDTPPLARGTTGPGRLRELLTGVGARP